MFNKIKFLLKAKKPELLLFGGLAALGAGIVCACNASRHVDEVLDDTADEIDEIRETMDGVAAEKAIRKERAICAWELFKMYILSFILILLGVLSILSSHSTMVHRLEGASLKLAETAGAFAAYRTVVRRDLGEDADKHFMYNTGTYEDEIPEYTDDDGVVHPSESRVYADTVDSGELKGGIVFDERSIWFDRENPQNNITFLHLANEDLMKELKYQGFLFDERIKQRLGYTYKDITADDKVSGHTYDGTGPIMDENGNALFDLGLYNAYDRAKRMNGELGKTFVLYPTSYGKGSTYILDKFENMKLS